jgi:hypothetical protein
MKRRGAGPLRPKGGAKPKGEGQREAGGAFAPLVVAFLLAASNGQAHPWGVT